MRMQHIVNTLVHFYNNTKRPIRIVGAPGNGKSTAPFVAAETLKKQHENFYIQHLHAPMMLVEDFGIPHLNPESGRIEYYLPHWWPAPDATGFLLLDDGGQADQNIQKVMANIEQARELHGHKLPDGVMIVVTGNRVEDRAGANRTLSHLADRETEVELEANLDDLCKFMLDNGHPIELVTFLRYRPNLVHDFDPNRPKNPTPRSWCEGVSPLVNNVDPELEYELYKGAVGEGAAAEFTGFMKVYRKMPDPDMVLMHPDSYDVPTDPATLYGLSGALAQRASEGNFDRVIKAVSRMPKEFSVLAVSIAVRQKDELTDTAAFTKWIIDHKDVMF
jgi:hypothetical protein